MPVIFVIRRVLWTLVPIGSLGLLGWVPPLRIAFRRKTPAAWLWFAGSAVGIVLVAVLATTVREAPNLKDTPPAWVGGIEILYIIGAAVYTGIATKALTPKSRPTLPPTQVQEPYAYAYGWYPEQPAAYLPPPPAAAPPSATWPIVAPPGATSPVIAPHIMTPPVVAVSPSAVPPSAASPIVAPNAVDAAAAEVQAELRELRDLLDESAAGRQREGHDRRDQW